MNDVWWAIQHRRARDAAKQRVPCPSWHAQWGVTCNRQFKHRLEHTAYIDLVGWVTWRNHNQEAAA